MESEKQAKGYVSTRQGESQAAKLMSLSELEDSS